QAVEELRDKCGLSAKDCRAALVEHAGAVAGALAALIDAGKVGTDALNPETVSDELFERAARRQKLILGKVTLTFLDSRKGDTHLSRGRPKVRSLSRLRRSQKGFELIVRQFAIAQDLGEKSRSDGL